MIMSTRLARSGFHEQWLRSSLRLLHVGTGACSAQEIAILTQGNQLTGVASLRDRASSLPNRRGVLGAEIGVSRQYRMPVRFGLPAGLGRGSETDYRGVRWAGLWLGRSQSGRCRGRLAED